jgi:subtilisin family serine protease
MKKLIFLITLLITSVLSHAQVEKQLIVVPEKSQVDMMEAFLDANQVKVLQHYDQLGWYLVKLSDDHTQDSFIRLCKDFSFIAKVYKDEEMTYSRDYVPNDTQFSSQWYLRQTTDKDIDADLAWDSIPTNNTPTIVAVFDGGIDISHEDLVGNLVTPFNAVTNQPSNGALIDPLYDRHGTACTGTIAAVTNNTLGVASVGNNKVKVMSVNIMTYITSGGSFGTTAAIQINAINAAIAQGCVAISMSYGGSSYSQALNDAFIIAKNQARNGKGLFICASTGNNSSGTITQYPASYSAVYGIGATTSADLRASFSNYGNIVDISAPGASILTTDLTGTNGYSTTNYASVSGTSFSCPITAAAGALLIYKNTNLTEAQVMSVLASTAEKIGGYIYTYNANYPLSTRSNELGYGRINLFEAVKAVPLVGNPIITPPTPQHNITITNCNVNNTAPLLGSTITITVTQRTTAPNLETISPKIQYRLSNDNLWSADDVIIGTDTSYIGNGIESEIETIIYNIPSNTSAGARYILIKGNYDNNITETTNIDNNCSVYIVLSNPGSTGVDLQAFWLNPGLTTCNNTTGSATTFRFKNTGSVPIVSFTARVYWENCPQTGWPTYYSCNVSNVNTNIFGGVNIQPNGLSGSFTFNTCIGSCGLASNPFTIIPLNTTRNLILEILTVNGQSGDSFIGNNTAIFPVTRVACSTNTTNGDIIELEEPTIKIYTITGMLLDINKIEYLSSGIYIIHYEYSDHVDIEKIIK